MPELDTAQPLLVFIKYCHNWEVTDNPNIVVVTQAVIIEKDRWKGCGSGCGWGQGCQYTFWHVLVFSWQNFKVSWISKKCKWKKEIMYILSFICSNIARIFDLWKNYIYLIEGVRKKVFQIPAPPPKKLRDVVQEREGASFNYFLTILNNFLGLSPSILLYLGLSRSILDYLGLSQCISVYFSLSR